MTTAKQNGLSLADIDRALAFMVSARPKADVLRGVVSMARLQEDYEADVSVFAAYCRAAAFLKKAHFHINAEGMIIDTPLGPVMNPWYRVSVQSLKELKTFAIEFGLTPSSRSRLDVKPVNAEEDPDAAMFGTAR